jgi:predicted transposase YdaD
MARGEKDHGTNWLTQHHARAVVRLLGLSGFRSCRPAHTRITLPQAIPDGLLEVEMPTSEEPLPILVEWEAYPSKETEQQVVKDMDLAEIALGVLPDTVVIILSPKGKAQTRSRIQNSALGWSGRRHHWRVLEMAKVPDSLILALNEVALIPLLVLSKSKQKPQTLLEQCRQRIEEQARPEESPTLLTITAIFATMRYARAEEWLRLLGGKTMLAQSSLYQQWMDEKERETRQDAIIRVLKARFTEVPEQLAAEIRTVTDSEHLGRGIDHAALCTSLKDFRKRFAKG